MNTHTNNKQKNESQSVANAVSQTNKNNNSNLQFTDNRPEAIQLKKLQHSLGNRSSVSQLKVIQCNPPEGEAPKVSDIYSTARSFFGSWGSPQIADIHKKMEQTKDPLLSEEADMFSGWKAGKRENEELRKLPPTNNWGDKFAKLPPSMFLRPPAASFAGGMMKYGHETDKVMSNPSKYPFHPLNPWNQNM